MTIINQLKVFWPLLVTIGILLVVSAFFSLSETARNIGRNTGGLDELRPCNFRSRRIKVGQIAVTHAAECSSKFLIRGIEIGARKRMKARISPLTDDTRGATASRDLEIDRQGTVVRDICKEGAIK